VCVCVCVCVVCVQVFDIASGQVVCRFRTGAEPAAELQSPVTFVRLTHDGRYVVWAEANMIVVGRVSDGFTVASVSAHERVTSLETADLGYVHTDTRTHTHTHTHTRLTALCPGLPS